jgi:hypothetical protein
VTKAVEDDEDCCIEALPTPDQLENVLKRFRFVNLKTRKLYVFPNGMRKVHVQVEST